MTPCNRFLRLSSLGLLSLTSCAAFTTIASPPSTGPHRLVVGTPWFDWKGVVHCHGRLSHDSRGTPEEIAAACTACGIDFLVMTDHQTDASILEGSRGVLGSTLFMVGAEIGCPQGSVLAFPLRVPLRRWQHPGLLSKEARDQGALTFVCHAERWRVAWANLGFTGAEIVNLHAGIQNAGHLGTLTTGLLLPIRFLLERACQPDARVLAAWDEQLAAQHPFTPLGGNDAHANVRVFGPLGGTIGSYREVFATLSTHALAERLDEASLVDAFRSGRTYVSFDIFGEGTGFDFRAVRGSEVHVAGASIASHPSLSLQVSAPAPGHIRLLREGRVVHECDGDVLVLMTPTPGVYRTEVWTTADIPWLFSGSIRVTD